MTRRYTFSIMTTEQPQPHISDGQLIDCIFSRFTAKEIAELTEKDERVVLRWHKSKSLSDQSRLLLEQIADVFGLADPEILELTDNFRRLSDGKRRQVHASFKHIVASREQMLPSSLDKDVTAPAHPMLELISRYHVERKYGIIYDILSAWSQQSDFESLSADAKARAYGFWGIAACRTQRYQQSQRLINQGLDLVVSVQIEVNLRMALSVCFDRQRLFTDAEKELLKCRELLPQDAMLVYNQMCFYSRNQKTEKASELLKELLEKRPETGDQEDTMTKDILSDPDLEPLRRSNYFPANFGGLAFVLAFAIFLFGDVGGARADNARMGTAPTEESLTFGEQAVPTSPHPTNSTTVTAAISR